MEYFSLLIGFLLLFILGMAITNSLIITGETRLQHLIIAQFLTIGVGSGIIATLLFFWINLTGKFSTGYVFFEGAIALCFSIICYYIYSSRRAAILHQKIVVGRIDLTTLILGSIFIVVLVLSANTFIQQTILKTRGGWDAWAFWNLNAEFIYKGGDLWKNLLLNTISWASPDYPLLLSSNSARLWFYFGRDSYFVPMIIAGLFWLAVIALLVSIITHLRGLRIGLTGGIVLLAIPLFTFWSAQQYADIPLSYFFLSAFICWMLANLSTSKNSRRGFLILAGIMAGYSVWVKNEGWLFILAFAISILTAGFLRKASLRLRDEVWLLAGMAPGILTAGYFKFFLAPSNDVMGQGLSTIFQRVFEFDRYAVIIKEMAAVNFDLTSPYATPVWISLMLILMFGVSRQSSDSALIWVPGLTIFLVFIGYFMIFVISPHDIVWHTETALNRLLLQLWPSIILTISLFTKPAGPHRLLTTKSTHEQAGFPSISES